MPEETTEAAQPGIIAESPTENTTSEVSASSVEVTASTSDTPSGGDSLPDSTSSSSESETPPFDYSSWNGNADSLPEAYRPIYDKISGGLQTEMESLQNSLQQDKELYEALLQAEGVDADVRKKLEETEKELAALREAKTVWATEREDLTKNRDDLQSKISEIERAEQAELQAWVSNFRTEHGEMLADPGKRERFVQYLESGMEPEFAVTLMEKDTRLTQRIQAYRMQGVPDQYALKLAMADLGTGAAQPRASAEMATGAGEPANNPISTEKNMLSNTSNIKDIRRLVAERAFKKHTG